ncbi:SPOSA6832_04769 [Sporobolomyces salmonicolor]|uniref:SPOSA6832_04769-mRNA-1:cds n=1 Tax=Sporidiobolus salmonicolor TaxID=5005 RepID=A0A0D6ETI4_SPOSA|nr:SPOSA6832_04769 [Sporobolomyces salmonicolor]
MSSRPASTGSRANSQEKVDLEKQPSLTAPTGAVVPEGDVVSATGPFAKVTRYLDHLGVETRSLERVPEDQRDQMFFWLSVNMSFSALGTGFLGSLYYTLDFPTSMAIIWLGTALGCTVSATMATLGPKTGLRTMALSRFAGGWPGTAIFSLLNALTQLCYAVTTALAGAQALVAINHNLSLIVGIVILTVVVFVLSIYGYRFLHYWERYAWIGCLIIYIIILGLGKRGDYDPHSRTADMDSGRALIGDVLSFFGIMFSVGSGWTSIAADYNMTLPVDTPTYVVWLASYFGMWLPIAFTCSTSAAFLALTKASYVEAFEEGSLGGVVGQILSPAGGFGKFLLVLLAFSTVSANIPNTYSGALCLQSIHPILMKVPRIFFVIIFTAVLVDLPRMPSLLRSIRLTLLLLSTSYIVVAIVGKDHFSEILSNFSAILAYYTAFLSSIIFIEYFWFRRPGGRLGPVKPDDFTDYSKLAPGYACVASIVCTIPVVASGLAADFPYGPKFSDQYGQYMGESTMSYVVSAITYPIFRTLEIRYFGR